MSGRPILRVARPTSDLQAVLRFYKEGLGLAVLASFQDHQGLSGVILGGPEAPYHFEFTTGPTHQALSTPHPDDLIVFYLPARDAYEAAIARIEAFGAKAVPALNPWWDEGGRTYQDPDGRRIVLTRREWTL